MKKASATDALEEDAVCSVVEEGNISRGAGAPKRDTAYHRPVAQEKNTAFCRPTINPTIRPIRPVPRIG